jgi:ABC-type bacteriocin/lantibiotic exporter with double-glycine peptidase domain
VALPERLTAGLTDAQRELAEASMETLTFGFGDTVVAQGDEPQWFYAIVAGRARVVREGDDGAEVSLNLLEAGDVFGERAVLEGGVRTATIRAASELTVRRLHRSVFWSIVRLGAEANAWASAQARGHRMRDILRREPVFAGADPDFFAELAAAAAEHGVGPGDVIAEADAHPDHVAVLLDGRAVAAGGEDGDVVGYLRPGALVGAREVLTGTPMALRIEATEAGRVARIGVDAFVAALDDRPDVRRRLQGSRRTHRSRGGRTPLDFAGTGAAEEAAAEARRASGVDPEVAARYAELAAIEAAMGDDATAPPAPDASREPIRRFPLVRQLDAQDCGAACLAMVCRHFGRDVSLNFIRQAVGTSADGTTLRGLQRGGEEVGVAIRAIKSSPETVADLPLPAILHWGGNHWVVLYAVEENEVRIADPGLGRRKLGRDELAREWSGYTALATPTPRLAEAPRQRIELGWLLPLVRPHWKAYAAAIVLAGIVAGLEMLLPTFSQRAVDEVIPNKDHAALNLLLVEMVAVIVAALAASLLQRYLLARTAVALDRVALDRLTGRLLLLPMKYFQSRRTADIQRRVIGVQQIRAVVIENGLVLVTSAFQFVAAIAFMLATSVQLGLIFLATVPFYVLLARLSTVKLRPMMQGLEESSSRYTSRQIDTIRGIEAVKLAGAEEHVRRTILGDFRRMSGRLFQTDLARLIFDGAGSALGFVVFALFLFLGVSMVLDGSMTVGGLVAFNALVAFATLPLGVLLGVWDDVQFSNVLFSRLQDVFEQDTEQPEDRAGLRAVPDVEGRVTFRGVSFHYPRTPERKVLEDVTLDIAPGSTVVFVGRSGSGKSTLVRMVSGLILPVDGDVRLDGLALGDLRFDQLRRRVGFVPQHPYVFDETIAANIAYGDDVPDLDRARRAAELAAADEFISALPLGYQTRVGDSGMRLSGGESQRLAIARALYRDPPVLIMDEATSALDAESERMLQRNLAPVVADRTALIVTHRLHAARAADLVCVVERGRIVERGEHAELLERGGLYAHLWEEHAAGSGELV